MSAPVAYDEAEGVAWITLDRPAKFNAIDDLCLELIDEYIATANKSATAGAIVIAGSGRHFCTGADLFAVESHVNAGTFGGFLERWHAVFAAVEASAKPTVAAVHGLALAGGFELTQVCDVVVAEAEAALGDAHSKRGLFPGGGSTQRLPRLIGRRRAMWMLLSGDRCDAQTALDWGLVSEIVPAGQARARAAAVAAHLAGMSWSTSRAIKAAVHQGAELFLDAALELERTMAVQHMSSEDARAGMRSFSAKKKSVFAELEARNPS